MFLLRANKLPVVSSVLKETLRLECLNNLMINLVCLPTHVNLAHLCCVFPSLCSRSSFIGLTLLKLLYHVYYYIISVLLCRSQWPRSLRRRSAAARLLRSWVRIPPGAWISVCCECCVCCQVEVSATIWSLVQRSSNDFGVSLCMRRPWPTGGCHSKNERLFCCVIFFCFFSFIHRVCW